MIIRMGLLKKKVELSSEEFVSHWVIRHGPLAKRLPGLRGYVQNMVLWAKPECDQLSHGSEEFDGFSQLWFETREAMDSAIQTHFGPALSADELLFISTLYILLGEESIIISPQQRTVPSIKCLSFLRRSEDLSTDQFRKMWLGDDFVRSVSSLPGIRGYRRNIVFERQVPKGTVVDYKQLPIDGVSEAWFETTEALNDAFSSIAGRRAVAQAKDFVAESTSFIIDEHTVM